MLNYLRTQHPLDSLSLKSLSLKLVMLVALVSAQRLQTLQLLDLTSMHTEHRSVTFMISSHVKQSRPGRKPLKVVLSEYEPEASLCVHKTLLRYLDMTSTLRGQCTKLFVSFVKPHGPVSKDTLARWIKTVMATSGINVRNFSAHSTRAASTSAALASKVPVNDIMRAAG